MLKTALKIDPHHCAPAILPPSSPTALNDRSYNRTVREEEGGGCTFATSISPWSHAEKFLFISEQDTVGFSQTHSHEPVLEIDSTAPSSRAKTQRASRPEPWRRSRINEDLKWDTKIFCPVKEIRQTADFRSRDGISPAPLECGGGMWGYSDPSQRDLCLTSESYLTSNEQQQSNWSDQGFMV